MHKKVKNYYGITHFPEKLPSNATNYYFEFEDAFDGYNDYEFLLKMFRKTNKSDITEAQHRKIRALIVNSILPYLRSELKFRKV